jgi:hypothetical protein
MATSGQKEGLGAKEQHITRHTGLGVGSRAGGITDEPHAQTILPGAIRSTIAYARKTRDVIWIETNRWDSTLVPILPLQAPPREQEIDKGVRVAQVPKTPGAQGNLSLALRWRPGGREQGLAYARLERRLGHIAREQLLPDLQHAPGSSGTSGRGGKDGSGGTWLAGRGGPDKGLKWLDLASRPSFSKPSCWRRFLICYDPGQCLAHPSRPLCQ